MESQDRAVPSFFVVPLTLFFVGILLFVALLNGRRDLVVLTLLVLGLAIGAKLWARMSLSGLRCPSTVDKEKLFPGERLTLKMGPENGKFLPVWFRVEVPVSGHLLSSSDGGSLTGEGSLLWHQGTQLKWELIARRRGVHHIGPSHIEAGDLFAFFSKRKRTEEFHSILVYPRLVPLKSFSPERRDLFGIPGAKSPVHDPVYILGTREYQQGQPARYIHWKASARHNRLQEKIFEPSEQEKVLLVVRVDQFSKEKAEEEFEHTLEVVASLAVRLGERGCAVGLATNGFIAGGGSTHVPIAKSRHQLSAILEVLARLRMEAREDLANTFRDELELPWGPTCLLFSYEEDRTTVIMEDYFRQRKIPMVSFACRVCSASGTGGTEPRHMSHLLDDVCIREAGGK